MRPHPKGNLRLLLPNAGSLPSLRLGKKEPVTWPLGNGKRVETPWTDLLKSNARGTESFQEVFRNFASSLHVRLGCDRSKWLEEMKQARTDLSKAYLLRSLRNRVLSPSGLRWLDAVGMSLSRVDDSESPWWFPLLANGGGEASGQYIVNHQQRLNAALLDDDKNKSRSQLLTCLIGENYQGSLEGNSMGAMYYPSLMKAPNVGQDFLPNPRSE